MTSGQSYAVAINENKDVDGGGFTAGNELEMHMLTANRITDFFPKSVGPKSPGEPVDLVPTGKVRDGNNVQPGTPPDVFAKLITPPADARLNDKRFAAVRQQLMDQYRPTQPVQFVDIDLIASDLLHLASLRQAMEMITAPAVPAKTADATRQGAKNKKVIDLLKRLIRRGEACHPFDCSEKEAGILAPELLRTFERLREWVAEADAEAAESAGNGADNAENLQDYGPDPEDPRCRQILEIVLPIESALRDSQHTMRVLSGDITLSPTDQIRWAAILRLAMEDASTRNYRSDEAMVKFTAAQREVLVALAQDPVRLAVLHRCASQFEEAVAKRIRRLTTG